MPKSKPGCAAYLIASAVVIGLGWLLVSLCGEEKDVPEAERKAREAVNTVIARIHRESDAPIRDDLKYWMWCENPKGTGVVVGHLNEAMPQIGYDCWLVVGDEIQAVTGGFAKNAIPSIEFSGAPGSMDETTFEVTPKSGLWIEDVERLLKPFN
ncbi:MAG TPA: hypothetical protein VM054_08420 [bacterium]|nr:hypothetical protein [bacterium]